MTNFSSFRDYCIRNKPTVIIYDDENNDEYIPDYTQRGKICNPLKLRLTFDSISVWFNPNIVVLKGVNGTMRFGNVIGVDIKEADSLLGDTITLYCSNSEYKKSYTIVMR